MVRAAGSAEVVAEECSEVADCWKMPEQAAVVEGSLEVWGKGSLARLIQAAAAAVAAA